MECGHASVKPRSLSLIIIEFLTKLPALECIVTSENIPNMNAVIDMFPKTLFHVFCGRQENPPRANAIRHETVFDLIQAGAWSKRGGAPFQLIFTGETMQAQMELHCAASPAAALLMVTSMPQDYIDGTFVFPHYAVQGSIFGCIVPSCSARLVPFRTRYYDAVNRHFDAQQGDPRKIEDRILMQFVRMQVQDPSVASLMVEIHRTSLPSLCAAEIVFANAQADELVMALFDKLQEAELAKCCPARFDLP